MAFIFQWNKRKAKLNLRNHDITFEEAATVFADPLSRTIEDPLHSEDEDRWVLIGESKRGQLLVVVHVARGDIIRIISARVATPTERKKYEESNYNSI